MAFAAGLVVTASSTAERARLAEIVGAPWLVALVLASLAAGVLFTIVFALALWFYIKIRLFPTPPAQGNGGQT
jgi:hypothetical protein